MIIKAVGDIAPGDCTVSRMGMLSLTKKYGCSYPFEKLGGVLNGADLLLGNLEGVLSERVNREDLRLCGLPEMAKELKKHGFDVLSIANNHSYDYGPDVFEETVYYCNSAGIEICGLRGNSDYYCNPVIIEKKGISVGILAYNWVGIDNVASMGSRIAIVQDSTVNYTWNRNNQKDREARKSVNNHNNVVHHDIRKLRKHVDILILMPHWGYEWTHYPPYGVILEARSFISAGADLIIGSHPHVIQGVENYMNKLIAYSLGNFIFDSSGTRFNKGMILEAELGASTIKRYKMKFIKWDMRFQPEPVSNNEEKECETLIKGYNEAILSKNVSHVLDDEVIYSDYEREYNNLKLQKVKYLLRELPKHPFLVIPILKKVVTLFHILFLCLTGKRVRW